MQHTSPGASTWTVIGATLAGLAVVAGAFGAHALREQLSASDLGTFETAARYQMYHALALLFVGRRTAADGGPSTPLAGWLFLVGILLFSGSLYAMTLGGPRWLGGITPLGGGAFIAGWGVVAASAFRRHS